MGPVLLPILDVVQIVQGGALGADMKAHLFARGYGLNSKEFVAEWDRYGNSAGPKRNIEMANYCRHLMDKYIVPGYCFAFWDGQSNGTRHMIKTAEENGLTVHVERYLPRELYFNQLLQEWQDKFKQRAQKLKLI